MEKIFTAFLGLALLAGALSILEALFTPVRKRKRRQFQEPSSDFGDFFRDTAYERRPFIFDAASEFHFYKHLLTWFGDQYHVFPQIGYGRLIKVKDMQEWEKRGYWRRIDSRVADFVICDKERVMPKLVIELDGNSHYLQHRRDRDELIDAIAQKISLPILHIRTDELENPHQVRMRIENALKPLSYSSASRW